MREPFFFCLSLLTLLVSKVMCCQITGLFGIGGKTVFGGENEEHLHMHSWQMNKVWSLPSFFAEVLPRRKAVLADRPFD